MENISSYQNSQVNNNIPYMQKRMSNQEFTALDTEKLKKDSVELANKAKENANENFIFKTLRNIGVKEPKKTLKSLAYSVITVVAVAILGNKLTMPANKLGDGIDKVLTGNNIFGKCRSSIIDLLTSGKDNLKKLPVPAFIKNAAKAIKKGSHPRWTIFRGFENGAKGLFSNTITETFTTALKKDRDAVLETLTNLFKNKDLAKEYIEKFGERGFEPGLELTNVKFADQLLQDIAKTNGCINDKGIVDTIKLSGVLENLSSGGLGEGLRNIEMNQGGFTGAWWPANFINKVFKKLWKKEIPALQGNVGDSLIKYGAVRGKTAQTATAKFVKIVPPLVGDQVSNFVNDKSGFGVLLCANLIGNFNNIQDAPTKKQKVQTALNDVASGSISWLAGMPLTYGAVYSLASLRNIEGKGIMTGLTRTVGKFFGMGLDKTTKFGGATGVMGGVMRFALAMFIFHPFILKQISKVTNKIFGKPYDPAEVEKAKQAEEAKNQIIPELNITQGELLEKMQNNPDVMQKIQNDPELLAKVQQDPKFLLELLDGKNENKEPKENVNIFNGQPLSPANKNVLSKRNNVPPTASNNTVSNIPSNTTNNTANKIPSNTSNIANNIPSNTANNAANNTTPNSSTNSIFKPKENKNNSANNSQIAPGYDPEKGFDNLTYIPSSEAAPVPESLLSAEQKTKYNAQMEKADRALKRAEKFI